MSNMNSTSSPYTSSQLLGKEHSSNSNQQQTVSLRNVNEEESTTYPTYHQPLTLQGYNPTPGGVVQPQPLAQPAERPKKRGRGYTGMPKGRPPGAKNKQKGPDHGLPKLPKKRGRPLGAKNKYPRGGHNAFLPGPDNDNADLATPGNNNAYAMTPDGINFLVEGGFQETQTPFMAGMALDMPPTHPKEVRKTYTAPDGYGPATDYALSLRPDDRGFDETTGDWYSIESRARELEAQNITDTNFAKAADAIVNADPSQSNLPENTMTPMTLPYAPTTISTYGGLNLGNGHFTNGNNSVTFSSSSIHPEATPVQWNPIQSYVDLDFDYGNNDSSTFLSSTTYPEVTPAQSDPTQHFHNGNGGSSNSFASSSTLPADMSAQWGPTLPQMETTGHGYTDVPAPTTSQAFNASNSTPGIDNSIPAAASPETYDNSSGSPLPDIDEMVGGTFFDEVLAQANYLNDLASKDAEERQSDGK